MSVACWSSDRTNTSQLSTLTTSGVVLIGCEHCRGVTRVCVTSCASVVPKICPTGAWRVETAATPPVTVDRTSPVGKAPRLTPDGNRFEGCDSHTAGPTMGVESTDCRHSTAPVLDCPYIRSVLWVHWEPINPAKPPLPLAACNVPAEPIAPPPPPPPPPPPVAVDVVTTPRVPVGGRLPYTTAAYVGAAVRSQ